MRAGFNLDMIFKNSNLILFCEVIKGKESSKQKECSWISLPCLRGIAVQASEDFDKVLVILKGQLKEMLNSAG